MAFKTNVATLERRRHAVVLDAIAWLEAKRSEQQAQDSQEGVAACARLTNREKMLEGSIDRYQAYAQALIDEGEDGDDDKCPF